MVLELAAYFGGGQQCVIWLLSMPVPSFISAFDSYVRVYSRRSKEYVMQTFVAAQSTYDGVEDYMAALDGKATDKHSKDASRFLSKFGNQVGG